MTQGELRAEFEGYTGLESFVASPENYNEPYDTRSYEAGYQACNAKRQEEMARDKALLRECAKELNDIHIHSKEPFTSHKWLFYAHDVSGKVLEKLAILGITVGEE